MKKLLLKICAPILAIPYAIGIFAVAFMMFVYAFVCIIADKVTLPSLAKVIIAKRQGSIVSMSSQTLSASKLSA